MPHRSLNLRIRFLVLLLCAGIGLPLGDLLPHLLWVEHDHVILWKPGGSPWKDDLPLPPLISGTLPASPVPVIVSQMIAILIPTELSLVRILFLSLVLLLGIQLMIPGLHPVVVLLILLDPAILIPFTCGGAVSLALPWLCLGILGLLLPPQPLIHLAMGFSLALAGALHAPLLPLILPLILLQTLRILHTLKERGGSRTLLSLFLLLLGGLAIYLPWVSQPGFLEELRRYLTFHPPFGSFSPGEALRILWGFFTLAGRFFAGLSVPWLLAAAPEVLLLLYGIGLWLKVKGGTKVLLLIILLFGPTLIFLMGKVVVHFTHLSGLRLLFYLGLAHLAASSPLRPPFPHTPGEAPRDPQEKARGGRVTLPHLSHPLSWLPSLLLGALLLTFLANWIVGYKALARIRRSGEAHVPTLWENLKAPQERAREIRTLPNLLTRKEVREFVGTLSLPPEERSHWLHGSLSPSFLETGWWFYEESRRGGESTLLRSYSSPDDPKKIYFLERKRQPQWEDRLIRVTPYFWVYAFHVTEENSRFLPFTSLPKTLSFSRAVRIPLHEPHPPPRCPASSCLYLVEFYRLDPAIWKGGSDRVELRCPPSLVNDPSPPSPTTQSQELILSPWGVLTRCQGRIPRGQPPPLLPSPPSLTLPYAGVLYY